MTLLGYANSGHPDSGDVGCKPANSVTAMVREELRPRPQPAYGKGIFSSSIGSVFRLGKLQQLILSKDQVRIIYN